MQEVLSKIREGYGIEDICFANDELYGGKEIKDIISNLDSDWICIETIYKELVYIIHIPFLGYGSNSDHYLDKANN